MTVFRILSRSTTLLAAIVLGGCMHDQSRRIDQSYPTDYRHRHPIMVSPASAYVPHQCGQWPGDLGVSDGVMDAHNKPYWNFGCATQRNLALMVARPSDLLGPAQETRPPADRRVADVYNFNQGKATNTDHRDQHMRMSTTNSLTGGGSAGQQ